MNNQAPKPDQKAERKAQTRRHAGSSRGFALAGTMMALMVLLALMILGVAGSGIFSTTTGGVQMAGMRANSTNAFSLAESGADYARLWLAAQPYPPTSASNAAFTPFTNTNGVGEWGATVVAGTPPRAVVNYPDATHKFSVTIYPIIGSLGSNVKNYLIESIGTSGSSQAVLHVQVQLVNFAKYAFFDDNDHYGGVWGAAGVYFEGPYHSNNSNGVNLGFNWFANNQASPLFQMNDLNSFSFSGNPVWYKNMQQGVAPSNSSEWQNVTAGGQPNMTYGFQTNADGTTKKDTNGNPIPNSPRIALPTTDNTQQYAALGQAIPTPATTTPTGTPVTGGVTLYPGGGIYIHADTNVTNGNPNDVQTMAFSALADAQGNKTIQQILINQPVTVGASTVARKQRITINPGTNMTTLETSTNGGSTWTTTGSETGTTNGVIYADCNIGSETTGTGVSGVIADNVISAGVITHNNALTLTTNLAGNKNITAAGSLTYNTPRTYALAEASDSTFLTHAGTLGVVTNQFYTPNDTGTLSGSSVKLEFDATIFAKDTFTDQDPSHYELNTGYGAATMTMLGGVIEGNVAAWHYAGGYVEQYHYDTRMANSPPPYFPTTGSKYTVISWQRVPTTLE